MFNLTSNPEGKPDFRGTLDSLVKNLQSFYGRKIKFLYTNNGRSEFFVDAWIKYVDLDTNVIHVQSELENSYYSVQPNNDITIYFIPENTDYNSHGQGD